MHVDDGLVESAGDRTCGRIAGGEDQAIVSVVRDDGLVESADGRRAAGSLEVKTKRAIVSAVVMSTGWMKADDVA
jgi:hypothetical protein